MLDFIYNTPTTVHFGKDKEKLVGEIIKGYGYKKIMLQYGKDSIKRTGLYDTVIKSLTQSGIEVVEVSGVEPNPKLDFVYNAIKIAKEQKVEMVLAVGGGSVIDSSKYTALGATTEDDVWDFAMAKKKPVSALPVGVILTHSASGSEMSSSAVVTNMAINMKKGCTSEFNRCKFVIMNPELTYTLSDYQTACGVVDIMSHTLERYFSVCDPTPLTDGIAESLLKAVISAGKILVENPKDYNARATVMWASSLSHNGLTGCGREHYLGVHQLEHALSGEFDHVAHGAGLAVIYPAWAKYVYKYNIPRFAGFARNVWGVVEQDDKKAAELGIEKMSEYFALLKMPSKLAEFNIGADSVDRLADLCTYGKSRTIKSYIPLDFEDIKQIFMLCL